MKTRAGGLHLGTYSSQASGRRSTPSPEADMLVADLKRIQAEMQTDSAELKRRLQEAEAERDANKALAERLQAEDRQKLRSALTNVQQNFQQSTKDRASYSASLRELAETEAKRLQLSRHVQELRFQLGQAQQSKEIAANHHKQDITRQLQKQAADTLARQQVHDAEVKQLRDHAASVQRAADEAARRAAQELASVRADLEAVRASMQKERAAFAVAGAANNDAVWKARLRQQKADMDRIRAERDQLRSILAPVKQPRV